MIRNICMRSEGSLPRYFSGTSGILSTAEEKASTFMKRASTPS